jgi:hypothetical protein
VIYSWDNDPNSPEQNIRKSDSHGLACYFCPASVNQETIRYDHSSDPNTDQRICSAKPVDEKVEALRPVLNETQLDAYR